MIALGVGVVICCAPVGYYFWEGSRRTYDDALAAAVVGADRIRVRTGGTCHRSEAEEETILEERDPGQVREFLRQIRIDDRKSGFHCMCCGDFSFEVYRGEELLVTIGLHHGRSLRWSEGWKGDGLMTEGSAAYLKKWFLAHGVVVPG